MKAIESWLLGVVGEGYQTWGDTGQRAQRHSSIGQISISRFDTEQTTSARNTPVRLETCWNAGITLPSKMYGSVDKRAC